MTKPKEVTVWRVWDPLTWPDNDSKTPQLCSYTFRRQPTRWWIVVCVMEFTFHRTWPLVGDNPPAGCDWTPAEAYETYIGSRRNDAGWHRREAEKVERYAYLARKATP